MGNSQSEESRSPSQSKPPTPQSLRQKRSIRDVSRRPQSHASSSAAPAPPIANLVPSASSASTSTSNAHAHATVAHSPASGHSRARSITAGTPKLYPQDTASSQRSDNSAMGNSESRHRPPSRSATLPPASTGSEKSVPSPLSRPVDVPHQSDGLNEKETFEPSGPPPDSDIPESFVGSRFDRPPRLPLPIEGEEPIPGSPVVSPQRSLSSPLQSSEVDGPIPRRTSVISSTTVDDDDLGENDIFSSADQSLQPTVPTTITWRGHGEKVYVTGTFVNWERKFKLHRDKTNGLLTATLQLKPGTHHIKFLVNNDMVTSYDLPTTVDYTNILVNYVEVVAPLPSAQQQPPVPAEPMPIPGAAATAGQVPGTGEPLGKPLDIRMARRASETDADLSSTLQDTIAPEVQRRAEVPTPPPEPEPTPTQEPLSQLEPKPAPAPTKQRRPRPRYTKQIPQFLLDLDTNNPEDERFQRAKRVEAHLPQPPTLPMFMSKSILNANTPHKDDASVLIVPNHTVLNHLATSSIKNGVLATSGTTRYKRKVSHAHIMSVS